MAGVTPSGVTQYAPALKVAPCYMRSPNSTPIRAQNVVPITLPAEFTTQYFFIHCDPECYHSMLAYFITRVWWWNSMLFSEEFTTTNGVLLQEWEGACGTLWAHAFWNPNPWIILTNILRDRRALCCSSPTVIFLFLRTALSTRVFMSDVLAIVVLLPLLQSSSSKVRTPFCHTLLTLTHHSCKLQITLISAAGTLLALINSITAQTARLDCCSSQVTIFDE